jgi:hypothetical protein
MRTAYHSILSVHLYFYLVLPPPLHWLGCASFHPNFSAHSAKAQGRRAECPTRGWRVEGQSLTLLVWRRRHGRAAQQTRMPAVAYWPGVPLLT